MEDENLIQDAETNTESDKEEAGNGRYLFALWITFCIFFSTWFMKAVMRGRRQLRYNFDAIEMQLRRMQNSIDSHEENKAITEGPATDNTVNNVESSDEDKKTQ